MFFFTVVCSKYFIIIQSRYMEARYAKAKLFTEKAQAYPAARK